MASEDRPTHYEMAKQYELQGKLDSAIAEYKEVLRIDPNYASAHYSLGMVYRMQGKFDLANHEFEEVRRIDPKFDAHNGFDIIRQKAKNEQYKPSNVGTKRFMPLPLMIVISIFAAFIIGGPIATAMGIHNPIVGIIVAIVVFLVLSVLFGGKKQN